ncbi:PTS glucitol/sorbitol transporter subunit IIA [Pediococcus siamensis]|uniref:PTS glucitol/sorbitol transporter subunit IIA n=1 Tax=Pediococcus siamensis TaxID=381829 RepID=UPI00399F486C
MVTSEIVAIGKNAIVENDPLVILFGPEATHNLKDVAVIQKFTATHPEINLRRGSKIKVRDLSFEVTFCGKLVNANLNGVGHATFCFEPVPDTPLQSAIYLTPERFPGFSVGDKITYIF